MKLNYNSYNTKVSTMMIVLEDIFKRTRGNNSKKKQLWILNKIHSKTSKSIDLVINPILWAMVEYEADIR